MAVSGHEICLQILYNMLFAFFQSRIPNRCTLGTNGRFRFPNPVAIGTRRSTFNPIKADVPLVFGIPFIYKNVSRYLGFVCAKRQFKFREDLTVTYGHDIS